VVLLSFHSSIPFSFNYSNFRHFLPITFFWIPSSGEIRFPQIYFSKGLLIPGFFPTILNQGFGLTFWSFHIPKVLLSILSFPVGFLSCPFFKSPLRVLFWAPFFSRSFLGLRGRSVGPFFLRTLFPDLTQVGFSIFRRKNFPPQGGRAPEIFPRFRECIYKRGNGWVTYRASCGEIQGLRIWRLLREKAF